MVSNVILFFNPKKLIPKGIDLIFDKASRYEAALSSEENMRAEGMIARDISIRVFKESIRAALAVITNKINVFVNTQ
jgi:hypothetical protein